MNQFLIIILFFSCAASISVPVKTRQLMFHSSTFSLQETVLKSTRRVNVLAVFSQSSLIMLDPLMCSVTKQTAGGGWTVFQKRLDGSVDFYRSWDDYKQGFGNLNGEFWLGLDKINRLTKQRSRLRVDLEDTTGKTAYAEYDFFGVASENSLYKLSLGTYSGMCFDAFLLQ